MPKSEAPRKKGRPTADHRLRQVVARAQATDRRRQAQIANQMASINRLLRDGSYTAEMQTLFQASASLQVENEDLRAALRDLVALAEQTFWKGTEDQGDAVRAALETARALIALSGPVSESGASAG